MMSKSDMRREGWDVDSPMSWWEGWPLTAVAISFTVLMWGGVGWALAKATLGG